MVRAQVVRDHQGENRAADGEINQVARQPVRQSLNRGAGLFGPFYRLNDPSKGGIPAQFDGANLDNPGLVDRAGENLGARNFFNGHRLPCDRGLVQKRMSGLHRPVDRNPSAGSDQHNVAGSNLAGGDLLDAALTSNFSPSGQKIDQLLDGLPPPPDGEFFQNFCDQHKEDDQSSREEFPDGQGRAESDGHGKFHGHTARTDVFESLAEDRVTAGQRSHEANDVKPRKRLPEA